MGTTLTNGVYLPNEGERNCYAGLKTNWEILDQKVADVTALQQAVAGALHREIVESLPTTDIDPNTIYMILSGTSATENIYNEYMYISNAWELIGTSATDLTNYYTKSEVDGKLLLKASASDLTSHTGDTTIHVTASDKTKWNTLALIKHLRLVNAQVGSATTIPFSDFDDTNGIKAGDKCADLDVKVFEITAVDTANQTVTVTPLLDIALDANVVHTSGNESVGGIKNFTDDTYIKSLNFTNEVASTSSSSCAVMPLVTTVTYTDQTASKVARINLRITASGDKSLYPHENNQYALGLQSRKWSEVHAMTYYYGSSDVEFSQKFVTTDTAQDIAGNKNFKGLLTTLSDSPLWPATNNTTADITSLAPTCIHVERRIAGSLTDLSNGAWYVAQIGTGCFFFRQNTGTDLRYKHLPTNVVSKICVMSNDNKFISDLCPDTTNSYNLGNSSYKWSTINGLEPSALGMPDLANGIDISSYLNTGASTNDSYTALANGYIGIIYSSSTACGCYVYNYTDGVFQRSNSITDSTYTNVCGVFMPIMKNQTLNISTRTTENIVSAKFFPCLGNV